MGATEFRVDVDYDESAVQLVLRGELDRAVVPELEETYRTARAARARAGIQIDLSALGFCDLGGLRALLQFQAEGAVLVGSPKCLQRLFEVLDQTSRLPLPPSRRWPPAPRPPRDQELPSNDDAPPQSVAPRVMSERHE